MGRKGVSKQKTSKKSPTGSGGSSNNSVGSALAHAAPAPLLLDKREAVPTGKGGKKKQSK
jgi:hypothetical protein